MTEKPTRLQLALGFGCIYLVWGSTYLAIRWGVATIPPFVLGAIRFLSAGVILYVWCIVRGAKTPTSEQWRNTAVIGGLMLCVANGAVTWSEQRVSSGVASLVVASVPLWMVLGERLVGKRPTGAQLIGVAVGLIGVALLVLPRGSGIKGVVEPVGALVLTLGAMSWVAGSLISRRIALPKPATLSTAMQMLSAGTMLTVLALVSGQARAFDPADVTARSMFAVVYLIIFGSLIGFSAYMWLLDVASPTAVGTYAYVNPAVAVLLGVLLDGERLPGQAVIGMVVILVGVVLVSLGPHLTARRRAPTDADELGESLGPASP